jgi:hypothetical protein
VLSSLRLSALALLPAAAMPSARQAPRPAPPEPLVIRVVGERDAATPLRVVASGGRLTAAGVARVMASDTARVAGPAELTTHELVGVATFLSDRRSAFLNVVVRQGGREVVSASGEMVVVIHTPQGPQILAMAPPAEVRGAR